jgi:hypothetical protein
VPFGDHDRQPFQRILPDLAEVAGRVAVLEIPRPAAQEVVDVLHDPLHRQQQPGPVRELPDPVSGVLHGLVRGPARQEGDLLRPGPHPRAHQPMMKAEEIHALTTNL